MKDAKGHGSDAHSTGVNQVGQPATEYTWAKYKDGHYLMPTNDTVNGRVLNMGNQIGTIHRSGNPSFNASGAPRQLGEPYKRAYKASYRYNEPSGGNKPEGWSMHGSVGGAKKFVEGNLSKFWHPPNIKS
jgi:hypothetical protein